MATLVATLQGVLPAGVMARLGPLLAGKGPLVGLVAGAFGLTMLGLVALWSWQSGYSVLYAGLSSEEGGRTLAELQKLNISYKISEGGRVILVPAAMSAGPGCSWPPAACLRATATSGRSSTTRAWGSARSSSRSITFAASKARCRAPSRDIEGSLGQGQRGDAEGDRISSATARSRAPRCCCVCAPAPS